MYISPYERDFRQAADPDIIRACRREFFKGIPELPVLTVQKWKQQPEIFRRAYAEALVWNNLFGKNIAEALPEEIVSFCPFGSNTPELKNLLQWRGAVALFPICSENSSGYCHLYLFDSPGGRCWADHRNILANSILISQKLLVYVTRDFSRVEEMIDGSSWQLACRMAQRALITNQPGNQKKLVQYLITGEVLGDGKILPVKIEKKTELLDKYPELTLLAPEANLNDLTKIDPCRCKTAADTDQAWRLISGSGFEKKTIFLPDPIEELHILAGGTIQPLLTVILLLNPKKVCIWSSDSDLSRKPAEEIRNLLAMRTDLKILSDLRQMDSHDLQQAYSDLDQILGPISDKSKVIICNTGGNRLMGFAALLAAQTYGISVVYRDFNAAHDCLTGIRVNEGERQSSDIEINRCPIRNAVNWNWLYDNKKYNDLDELYNLVFPET